MRAARIQVIIAFFLTVSVIVTYKFISSELVDSGLKQARIAYETEKLQLEREQLKRYNALEAERFRVKHATLRRDNDLNFFGLLGLFSAVGLAAIIFAWGHSRARVKQASVYIARIGQHSEIPIHQRDLQNFYPIAVNLSLAEIEASTSTAHEKAYRISRQMINDITDYTRAIAGKRGLMALGSGGHDSDYIDIPVHMATPTFADLLHSGALAPDKPLILGYDRQGHPQYRTLQDLKSLAVAGWQGSGKTLSMAYIVASGVLAYGIDAYIVDPHKHHHESLYSLIKPLESTGHVTAINPFDTPDLIHTLNRILDRRLSGKEPSEPGILVVIDEMARLAKMDCFDTLIAFLERCTEETRKANITFIGGSNKWTARHFKGRADIRGCMNSVLIHKMKPSQADLLLEDAHDKNLVKHLQRPGEAILVTDYDSPILVTVPLCRREDMKTVADIVNGTRQPTSVQNVADDTRIRIDRDNIMTETSKTPVSADNARPLPQEESAPVVAFDAGREEGEQKRFAGVIPFAFHFNKKHRGNHQITPQTLTVDAIQEQLQRLKTKRPSLTQAEIAKQVGMSQSHLSMILRGKRPLTEKNKQKLYQVLFNKRVIETPISKH